MYRLDRSIKNHEIIVKISTNNGLIYRCQSHSNYFFPSVFIAA